MSHIIDPPPLPPEKPLPGDCCGGGCAVCVWETYDDALRHYQAALAAWQARAEASRTSCRLAPGKAPD